MGYQNSNACAASKVEGLFSEKQSGFFPVGVAGSRRSDLGPPLRASAEPIRVETGIVGSFEVGDASQRG